MIKLLIFVIVAGVAFGRKLPNEVDPTEEPEKTVESLRRKYASIPDPGNGLNSYLTNLKCWTDWFDSDNPSGSGDWEIFYSLYYKNYGKICRDPTDIDVETLFGTNADQTGETFLVKDPRVGFVCINKAQRDGFCMDYRVRFACYFPFCAGVCWTRWFDRDNPRGSGDYESLVTLRAENPGQICEHPQTIEAVTTDTNTPASDTREIFKFYNPTEGFYCRNSDQKRGGRCRNYKVRFECPCRYGGLTA